MVKKLHIEESLNRDLLNIYRKGVYDRYNKELQSQLNSLMRSIPIGTYILEIGERGYNSAYIKTGADSFKWLYNNDVQSSNYFFHPDKTFIVLPTNFKPGERINYEDDVVRVWELSESDEVIYEGIEDYEPMKDARWKYCERLGAYYIMDRFTDTAYIKVMV